MATVTVKRFTSLIKDPTSAENIAGQIEQYPINSGDTINDIIKIAELPEELLHLDILNGTYIDKEKRSIQQLTDGDVIAFWPPIVGG